MQLTWFDIPFFLLFFLFSFFSLFLFLNQKGRRLSNFLLGGFFGAMGLNVIDGYFLYRDVYQHFPKGAFWVNAVPALFGPLLYFYTKSVLYKDFQLKWKHTWHAGLFLLSFLLFVFLYHIQPTDYQLIFLEQAKTYTGIEVLMGNVILIAQIGLYLFFSFQSIRQYKRAVEHRFSVVPQEQLSWLRFNLLSYSVVYFLILLYSTARFTLWEGQMNLTAVMVSTLFLLAFILSVLYRALTQSNVFAEIKESDTQSKKYAWSGLSNTELQQHFQDLLHLMESHKPWLEPKLTIGDLAQQMKLPTKTLSQVINETTGQNFFDFYQPSSHCCCSKTTYPSARCKNDHH